MLDWIRRLFSRPSRRLRDDEFSTSSALPATLYAAGALDDDAAPSDASGSDYSAGSDAAGPGFGGGS
jgi:hypothetical protein